MAGETLTVNRTATFKIIECYACGVEFAVTAYLQAEMLKDKRTFYCPSGHGQSYLGKSDEQRRIEAEQRAAEAQELARQKQRDLDGALRRLAKVKADAKASAARVEHRVESGVCLHCHRSFKALARHMHRVHGVENGAEAVDELAAKGA